MTYIVLITYFLYNYPLPRSTEWSAFYLSFQINKKTFDKSENNGPYDTIEMISNTLKEKKKNT